MTETAVDLNVDIGEGYQHDIALLDYASSANIACGWHAGDASTMRRVAEAALLRGVAVGAHPSYPDRVHFGRMPMSLPPEQIYADVQYQIGALTAIVSSLGGRLAHVKPHGALYNQAEQDDALAQAIVHAVRDVDPELVVFGLAGGQLVQIAREEGVAVVEEAFPDRRYTPDGKLAPRTEPDALLRSEAEVCEQALSMVRDGRVRARDGSWLPVQAETLCLHGDGPHACDFARSIRQMLAAAHVGIAAPSMQSMP